MLALSWCGGCGGKGEGPNNDIQELAAAVELMDRASHAKTELEIQLAKNPDDKELPPLIKKQDESFQFFAKKAQELKKKLDEKQ